MAAQNIVINYSSENGNFYFKKKLTAKSGATQKKWYIYTSGGVQYCYVINNLGGYPVYDGEWNSYKNFSFSIPVLKDDDIVYFMGDYSQEDDHSDKHDNLKWLTNRGKSITLDGESIGGVSGSSASLKFNITDKIKKYSGKTATFQFGAFFTSKGSGTATTGGLTESLGYVYHIKNLRIVIERQSKNTCRRWNGKGWEICEVYRYNGTEWESCELYRINSDGKKELCE